MSKRIILIFLLLLPALAACKVELYSNLSQDEANEMMALLLKSGIECDKVPAQEQLWTIRVDESRTAEALDILKSSGHPKQIFAKMGDIFKKEGLVSSPLEERIRYIYALSQELSQTISQIDGVVTARVHIVLPDNNPLNEHIVPSAASVFIKHRPECSMGIHVPQIKSLVVNSIEGLSFSKVTVVLFESQVQLLSDSEASYRRVLGLKVAPDSVAGLWILFGCMLLLFFAAIGGAVFLYMKSPGKHGIPEPEDRKEETSSR